MSKTYAIADLHGRFDLLEMALAQIANHAELPATLVTLGDYVDRGPDDRDEGGHEQLHIVHGHHQHAHGPILKKNRTNLDTFAWYTGRLVIAVFDDKTPGGPLEILEVQGNQYRQPDLC